MTTVGTWSYSGDPSVSARDAVRFTIGDTDETAPLLGDEEIDYVLDQMGDDVAQASIGALRRVMFRLARFPSSKSVEGLSITYGDLSTKLSKLLSTLQAEASEAGEVPTPWSPLTQMDKEAWAISTVTNDRYDDPFFSLDMEDSPGVGP